MLVRGAPPAGLEVLVPLQDEVLAAAVVQAEARPSAVVGPTTLRVARELLRRDPPLMWLPAQNSARGYP